MLKLHVSKNVGCGLDWRVFDECAASFLEQGLLHKAVSEILSLQRIPLTGYRILLPAPGFPQSATLPFQPSAASVSGVNIDVTLQLGPAPLRSPQHHLRERNEIYPSALVVVNVYL